MPFEEEYLRSRLERRARLSRMTREVSEDRFPVQPRDSEGLLVRDNARFDDLTGMSILGFSTLETMTT